MVAPVRSLAGLRGRRSMHLPKEAAACGTNMFNEKKAAFSYKQKLFAWPATYALPVKPRYRHCIARAMCTCTSQVFLSEYSLSDYTQVCCS